VVEGKARIVTQLDLSKAAQIVDDFWSGYSRLLVSSRDACNSGSDGGAILPLLSDDGSKLFFDIEEVESEDALVSEDWKKLRSLISTQYVSDVC
jgi:hypothetical protein